MKLLKYLLVGCVWLLLPAVSYGGSGAVSVHIPETVIIEMVDEAVPLEIPLDTDLLDGRLTVKDVKNLDCIRDGFVAEFTLQGTEMRLATELGGQKIFADIGDLQLVFSGRIEVHFDRQKRKLKITPVIDSMSDNGGEQRSQSGGNLLMSLIHGQTFTVDIEEISPYVYEALNKTLHINAELMELLFTEDGVEAAFIPVISSSEGENLAMNNSIKN